MSDPLAKLRRHQRFILDDEDALFIAEQSKPRLLLLNDQRTPQDLANEAWQLIADKHGFEWDSVRPSTDTLDKGIIRAIPLDPNRKEPDLPESARLPSAND